MMFFRNLSDRHPFSVLEIQIDKQCRAPVEVNNTDITTEHGCVYAVRASAIGRVGAKC